MGRHPWEITLREFIEKVHRDYGIEIEITWAAMIGSHFLWNGERMFPLPVINPDYPMPLHLLEFLCDEYRLPREDFHLDPRD